MGRSAGDIPACGDSQVGQGDLSVLEGDLGTERQIKMQFASKKSSLELLPEFHVSVEISRVFFVLISFHV